VKKARLDKSLVDRDIARSRSQAKELIENGDVLVNGFPVSKPASLVDPNDTLSLLNPEKADWVGRGGRKLYPYLEDGLLSVEGLVCLDVGSSTGGFTQALLKSGAEMVHAVDAGEGQLAYELRCDDRVVVHEQYNFRYADPGDFTPDPDCFVMDVSFISTRKLIPSINEILPEKATGLILVKPQFEAGADENQDGIVKSPEITVRVMKEVVRQWSDAGWHTTDLVPAALQGTGGNQEFFLKLERNTGHDLDDTTIENTVLSALQSDSDSARDSR
jgi:23S rRNA (cytidine1920-2'-O)/16S rRNA (cytidine1409-2'-O)-methyltransferase